MHEISHRIYRTSGLLRNGFAVNCAARLKIHYKYILSEMPMPTAHKTGLSRYAARSMAHCLLNAWACHKDIGTLSGNPLWYASTTMEGRMQRDGGLVPGGGTPGTRCPSLRADQEHARMQYMVTMMPAVLREIVEYRYLRPGLEGEKMHAWMRATGKSMQTYYRMVNDLYDYVIEAYPIAVRGCT